MTRDHRSSRSLPSAARCERHVDICIKINSVSCILLP
jgi:hypothetical protein